MASVLALGVIRRIKSTSSHIWKLDDMVYFKAEQDVIRSYQSRIHGSVSHLLETGSGVVLRHYLRVGACPLLKRLIHVGAAVLPRGATKSEVVAAKSEDSMRE